MSHRLQKTAHLIAASRALHEELSGDPYAKFFVPEAIKSEHPDYLSSVQTADSWLESIRNRFF